MKNITNKDYKEFFSIYQSKDFTKIKKFKGNKLSKFTFFMLFCVGSYANIEKLKEYDSSYIYDLFFQISDTKEIELYYLETFEFIYKFQAIGNLKNLSFNQFLQYILFCENKSHLSKDIILSLAYLYKK